MNETNLNYSKLQIWLLAARPKTLWAGVVPVIMGGALALDTGYFHLWAFLAALAGSALIQIGANFANDLSDFLKQTDREDRLGPLRVTQAGLVSLNEMKIATTIVFTAAVLVGLYLVIRAGIPILIIGATSVLFAVLYTGGPYPIGYMGLGDLFVFIYYGPVAVAGTFYAITLDISAAAILAGIPAGMISTAILTVNNLRDIDSDRRGGKKTLAVRFGRSFAKMEYQSLLIGAILFPVILLWVDKQHPWVLLACSSMIAAIPAIRNLNRLQGKELNHLLAQTGKLLALFGILFSIGWLL